MDCYAVERHVDWSKRGEMYTFRFEKNGHRYLWQCTEVTRRECLHAVALDAHNRELNLSLVDAVFIQDRIRDVIQPERSEWLEVEAAPVESAVEANEYEKDRWWLLSFLAASIVFWGWCFTLAIMAWQ